MYFPGGLRLKWKVSWQLHVGGPLSEGDPVATAFPSLFKTACVSTGILASESLHGPVSDLLHAVLSGVV